MIDYFRKENGWTMKEFGEKMGKSESAISKWIKGIRSPMVDDFERMVTLFGTDPDTLMYGANSKPKSKLLQEVTEITSKLDEPRQQVVLDTAKEQHKEQEAEKVLSLNNYKLSDEYLDAQINKASAYGGGELSDNDKEFFKRLLKNTLQERIDREE